jgi:hypothetical protein
MHEAQLKDLAQGTVPAIKAAGRLEESLCLHKRWRNLMYSLSHSRQLPFDRIMSSRETPSDYGVNLWWRSGGSPGPPNRSRVRRDGRRARQTNRADDRRHLSPGKDGVQSSHGRMPNDHSLCATRHYPRIRRIYTNGLGVRRRSNSPRRGDGD